MKKMMTMIVLVTLIVGQAIAGQAELHIKSSGNNPMTIFIDGQQVANMNTEVSVNGLADGNHFVEIFNVQSNGWVQNTYLAFSGNVYLPHNTLSKYKLKQNNQFVLQEQMALYVPQTPQVPVVGYGTVSPPLCGNDPYNNPPIQQPPVYHHPVPQNGGNGGGGQGNGGPGNGGGQGNGGPFGYTNGTGQNNYYYNEYVYTYGYDNNYGYNQYSAIDDADFNLLLNSISSQWFSSDMMDVYEQALNTNHFSAAQVKQLVNTFTYDSDKLKVAKTAYTQTIDKENYFVVYDALDYSSSIGQLTAYIATF